ncbi:uncharacterized protein LOC121736630 isoform X2 [Aricia agestis]|nr:uncharacterized protein LOC121736630 isoform X2 [Aricia agestis]
MTPASVARVLSRHAKNLPNEEIIEIVSKLRLKMVVTQRRTWHVIKLSEQISDEPVNTLVRVLPARVENALRTSKTSRNMRPEVQSIKMGDLIYISIQMVSEIKDGAVLYVAYPPGEAVALVSSLHSSSLKPCLLGLGYKKFEDAGLNGRDVYSLLRIINGGNTELPDHLAELPEFDDGPCTVKGGIDFTGRAAADRYAAAALGPDPPQLTKLAVTANKKFFNPDILNKKMKITIQLKSDDIAKTLHTWAVKRAIHPMSDWFRVFHQAKSNKLQVDFDDDSS